MPRLKSDVSAEQHGEVVARLSVGRGRERSTMEFEDVDVASGKDGFIVVTLRGNNGEIAVLKFARAYAKKLVSWRLLTGI